MQTRTFDEVLENKILQYLEEVTIECCGHNRLGSKFFYEVYAHIIRCVFSYSKMLLDGYGLDSWQCCANCSDVEEWTWELKRILVK